MKKYIVRVSVNGEEYIQKDEILCENSVDKLEYDTILIDDKIKIKFSEYIVSITRIK